MGDAAKDLALNYASDLQLIKSMYEDDSFWGCILDAKLEFLNKGMDPHLMDCVRPEIADSWMRTHDLGLEPDKRMLGEFVSDEEFKQVVVNNKQLISATGSLLNSIESINLKNDYVFELLDIEGLSLLQVGDMQLHQFVGENYKCNEGNMGTNSHSLCMRHKKPFVVIGPEHYCFALQSLIACSAPILDRFDKAIGSLVLTQPIPNDTFTSADKKVLVHAMSLLSSLATAISAQLRLSDYDTQLAEAESLYSKASLEAQHLENISRNIINTIVDGILVCDGEGLITLVTPEAGHIFRKPPEDLLGSNVSELLDGSRPFDLDKLATKGKTAAITIDDAPCTAKITRIHGSESTSEGFIVSLKESKRTPTCGVATGKTGDAANITFKDILGNSPQIIQTKNLAARFAQSHENILLSGESGTGKELFAQAIHNASRPNGPFVAINCAAIPSHLIESELFGYEGGSFTGADRAGKVGKIELAHGGTLFLDEIGDMPLELQSTLLRVLENKRLMRIGARTHKQVDFNLVAATNQNLYDLVSKKRFREDLFFRISVLIVNIPPLRDRANDPLYFARFFLNECQVKAGGGKAVFSNEALRFIAAYRWPGNVRQLKHAVYSAYYTCAHGIIAIDDFPAYITNDLDCNIDVATCETCESPNAEATAPESESAEMTKAAPLYESSSYFKVPDASSSVPPLGSEAQSPVPEDATLPTLSLHDLECIAIRHALEQTSGSIQEAAAILGISKATLYRKLKESC